MTNRCFNAMNIILGLIHLITPLLFFTDLTRNPYYTQIVLLNIGLLVWFLFWTLNGLKRGEVRFNLTSLHLPLAMFLLAAALSWFVSWRQNPGFRSGVWSEGSRVWLFTVVNCLLAFHAGVESRQPVNGDDKGSPWLVLMLALLWGVLWSFFSQLRQGNSNIWDPYGIFLWLLAIIVVVRYASVMAGDDFEHLLYFVGVIAAAYGIIQYFGWEVIWPKTLNPYSGRPVSTFGNPNFLSSYLIMLMPLVISRIALVKDSRRFIGYLAIFVTCLGAVLCTMTRSSWIGAAFSLILILVAGRKTFNKERIALVVIVTVILIIAWPKSPMSPKAGWTPSSRMTELIGGVSGQKQYAPWHQRLLIWSCAWDMVRENPFSGKGWGCFELFYPFYQGKYLTLEIFRDLRTHANNSHNVFLEFWSQTGTVGFGIALWLILVHAWMGHTIARSGQYASEAQRLRMTAFWAAGLGMWVDNFFGNVSLFFAVPAFLFWWQLGVLFGHQNSDSKTIKISSKPKAVFAGGLILTIVVLLSYRFVAHWFGEVYYFQGFKASKQNVLGKAIPALEASFRLHSLEVNNAYELANSYARQAKLSDEAGLSQKAVVWRKRAIIMYDAAISANAGYDEIYFNKGTVLAQTGNYNGAIMNYRLARHINPTSRDLNRALLGLYLGPFLKDGGSSPPVKDNNEMDSEAMADFEQAIKLFPDDPEMWNQLGYFYAINGRVREAMSAYRKALEINPQYEPARHNLDKLTATSLKPIK